MGDFELANVEIFCQSFRLLGLNNEVWYCFKDMKEDHYSLT